MLFPLAVPRPDQVPSVEVTSMQLPETVPEKVVSGEVEPPTHISPHWPDSTQSWRNPDTVDPD